MSTRIGSMFLTLIAVVILSLHAPQITAQEHTPASAAGNGPTPTNKPVISSQIKGEQYAAPAPTPVPMTSPSQPVVTAVLTNAPITGDKNSWLAASGIAQSDWNYVDYIISRESGWNPNATNSSSGAHGLPQASPYSKTGCGWTDAVCQLRWASGYAVGRYGSWAAAYSFWSRNHYW